LDETKPDTRQNILQNVSEEEIEIWQEAMAMKRQIAKDAQDQDDYIFAQGDQWAEQFHGMEERQNGEEMEETAPFERMRYMNWKERIADLCEQELEADKKKILVQGLKNLEDKVDSLLKIPMGKRAAKKKAASKTQARADMTKGRNINFKADRAKKKEWKLKAGNKCLIKATNIKLDKKLLHICDDPENCKYRGPNVLHGCFKCEENFVLSDDFFSAKNMKEHRAHGKCTETVEANELSCYKCAFCFKPLKIHNSSVKSHGNFKQVFLRHLAGAHNIKHVGEVNEVRGTFTKPATLAEYCEEIPVVTGDSQN
jgi:hypothetical protein